MQVPELAMQLVASLGPGSYWVYLVELGVGSSTLAQLDEEVRGLDDAVEVERYEGPAAALPLWVAKAKAPVLLVDATGFGAEEWASLDLQRSSLAHEGPVVFLAGHEGFSDLMRVAPNLASWLGGNVVANDDGKHAIEDARAHRLGALQSTFKMSNDEVVRAASEGNLPRDPDYAEWLVLLGRGDLL